jgi:choline transport protein
MGCVLLLVVTCAMHKSMQAGNFLLRNDLGTSGWDKGMAWILGISNAMYAFGGTDGGEFVVWMPLGKIADIYGIVIHISEEMPRPGRRVPQVMSMTMLLGLFTTLPLMIALNLFITDFQAVIDSPVPSIELVYQA